MQLITANIGNSSIKVAVDHAEHDHRWSFETVIRGDEPIDLDFDELDFDREAAFWSVASVNQIRQHRLENWVARDRPDDLFHVIQADEVGLKTDVESRESLGRDRLVAAFQAVQLNEGGPLIVIDAGTAVTIDVVDRDDVFQGGTIFPGIQSCLKFLAGDTDGLPNLESITSRKSGLSGELGFVGKTTESAILRGVYQSQISMIMAAVKGLSTIYGPAAIYVTGGGAGEIANWLPTTWQFVPDLVLQGAKAIGKDLLDQLIREP